TAVWSGSEMIVWGGFGLEGGFVQSLQSGGRYNPASNTWQPTATFGAPAPRNDHTAVWTGTYMIIWAGNDYPNRFNTGGRYDPATDTWTPTSVTGAPAAREGHSAVWTGG